MTTLAESGACALGDTRRGLDENRVGRGRRRTADHRAQALDDQRPADTRQGAVISARPASCPSPVIVPMASKKFDSTSANTSARGEHRDLTERPEQIDLADQTQIRQTAHAVGDRRNRQTQPPFSVAPDPKSNTDSTTTDTTVMIAMPSSRPPGTRHHQRGHQQHADDEDQRRHRGDRIALRAQLHGHRRVGGVRNTVDDPASTIPTNAMKHPIPAAIAALSSVGTALNTAVRNPVAASTTMMMPSITTRPIAAGHDICGRWSPRAGC